MDLKKLTELANLKSGIPDLSNPTDGLSIPDCRRTAEYGTHRDDREFDALHDFNLTSLELDSMTVQSGAILDGIVMTYADGTSVQLGGSGGSGHKIRLQCDSIKRVTGVCNVNFQGRRVISRLGVETASGKQYGPFGDDKNGSPFTLEGNGERIVAFFGSSDGAFVASLGGYLMK